MTHYIACPTPKCEGEIALALSRDGTTELADGPFMECSRGCLLEDCEQDAVWKLADSRAHEWEVADVEASVEASARANEYRP